MRRVSAIAVTIVLAARAALGADVPRDLRDYAVLGVQSVDLGRLSFVVGGHVGANDAVSGSSSHGGITLGRRVFMGESTAVVGDQCRLASRANVFDLFANSVPTSLSDVTVRDAGPVPFSPLPVVSPLPEPPTFVPAHEGVTIARHRRVALVPGEYGDVVVRAGAVLELTGGTYRFASLRVGVAAKVLVDAPAAIAVAGVLRVSNRAVFGPSTSSVGADRVHVDVAGRFVRFGANSHVALDLVARNARVTFGHGFFGAGRFIGGAIDTDLSAAFLHASCGNGILDAGEECDDGNRDACDGCSPACHREFCGDGTACGSEECDDGNDVACDGCTACHRDRCGDGFACANEDEECDDGNDRACDGCTACRNDRCGDGTLCPNEGEECDDGNRDACDGCSAACQRESCGDGIVCVSEGEECDPGAGLPSSALCTQDCRLGPHCGNGVLEPAYGEECDDGNATACDGCTACQRDRCGDGVTCPGEECDDANDAACDGCTGCQVDACGDGTTCANEGEECDDGNRDACDGCSPACRREGCGDGTVCASEGEECDDGNRIACDGCSATCQREFCGDGVACPAQGEQCDPPQGPDECPVCTADCRSGPTCGDGVVQPGCGEECDDGNSVACDGCTGCRLDRCGDGRQCPDEECDDGNSVACDGCTQCRLDRCGDGTACANENEQCDDGNVTPCDGCSAGCQTETCGDGVACAALGEECDPPSGPAGCPLCTDDCRLGPRCGDGRVDVACGEECDDGNDQTCDGCSGCKVDRCGDGVTCASEGEDCDDGNAVGCDGCTSCHIDTCGDGTACASENESCDDGNAIDCDGCTACRVDTCGDGVVCASAGEQCDPPDGATCDANCHTVPGRFCTLTQDEYGAPDGPANGAQGLVTAHPAILPVAVGAPGDLSLTIADQATLICFLPTGGAVAPLCTGLPTCGGDTVVDECASPPILDPVRNGPTIVGSGGNGAGTLAGAAVALRLSVRLSDAGFTAAGLRSFVLPPEICTERGRFVVSAGLADGVSTVGTLLVQADQALRDETAFQPTDPVTRDDVAAALSAVLAAFDGCASICR